MRKIDKDLNNIPSVLNSSNRKEAYEQNIDARGYYYGKGLYKVKSVEDKLIEIYHSKCAYCEKDISDDDKHIEHYRPKSRYFWLAYSWDNLILCCSRCNKIKGDKFETIHCSILYGGEEFNNIHNLGIDYDKIEQPKTINPERENILEEVYFDRDGQIFSKNSRVDYTINDVCNLNRKELIQKRIKVINGFINRVNGHFKHYLDAKNYRDYSMFEPDIQELIEECSIEREFYTFRYFIINHIEIFFENKILQSILKNKLNSFTKEL